MITRLSRQYNDSWVPTLVVIVTSMMLMLSLAGCQTMPRDSYERDIPAAVQASDFGLTDAEVSTSLDGFTKVIDVDLIFDTESISVDQLKQSLALVSEGLSASPSSRLIIAFYGPDQELLPGFEEVTNSLNDELQLGGYARMDGELGMLGFNPLSDLHDLVAKFGEG